jgi:hypothetical protein
MVDLSNYVEVKERIRLFYEAHPDGRLTTAEVQVLTVEGLPPRVMVHAQAFRTADDPHPADGWSWLLLPGTTNFTRGSELENTETSAWGRAIGALGIGIAGSIASANEVQSKAGDDRPAPDRPELERRASGMQGTVAVGKPPVDMNLRETPDGFAYGFKLTAGRKGYQALAVGPLAEALEKAGLAVGQAVTIDGHIEMIPWQRTVNGAVQEMPPYARIVLARVSTADWTLPADDEEATLDPGSLEAGLSAEEQAAMDALPW